MADADTEDWHSVLVLHQNRVQRTVAGKACIQEKHVPDFFDLVIWGHEHECRADAEVRRPIVWAVARATLHQKTTCWCVPNHACCAHYATTMRRQHAECAEQVVPGH